MLGSEASSGAGEPSHATGRRSPSCRWSAKPGILGPPVSPLPPMLRTTVELLATGPPTSWKLAADKLLTTLDLTWTLKPNNPPIHRLLIFPPALMTAIDSYSTKPATWSLQQDAYSLFCHLSWSTETACPADAAAPAPKSPAVLSSPFYDSGYSSPSSPSSPSCPIAFDLSSCTDTGSQTPPIELKTSQDAETLTPKNPLLSKPNQTSTPHQPLTISSTMQTVSPDSEALGRQTSPDKITQNKDVTTNTVASDLTNATCQTCTPSTAAEYTQTLFITSDSLTTSTTQTVRQADEDVGTQTSPANLTQIKDVTTNTVASDLANATSQTCTSITATVYVQTTPTTPESSPKPIPGTTYNKKKSRKSKGKHTSRNYATQPPAANTTTTAEASTSYEPPAQPLERWCKHCDGPISPNEPPLMHFYACGAIPDELVIDSDKFLQEFASTTKIPPEALRAAFELVLSSHDPDVDTSPLTSFPTEQICRTLIPDYNQYLSFKETSHVLIQSLIDGARSTFNIKQYENLSTIFTDIEPTSDSDEDQMNEFDEGLKYFIGQDDDYEGEY